MIGRVVIRLLLASLCIGCIPAQFTTVPGLSGNIVADAGGPVAGARVSIYPDSFGPTTSTTSIERSPIAQTSANKAGNVDLKPQTRWAILFAGMDFIQERVRISVQADGFQTASFKLDFSEAPSSVPYIDLGTVRLIRIVSLEPVGAGPTVTIRQNTRSNP